MISLLLLLWPALGLTFTIWKAIVDKIACRSCLYSSRKWVLASSVSNRSSASHLVLLPSGKSYTVLTACFPPPKRSYSAPNGKIDFPFCIYHFKQVLFDMLSSHNKSINSSGSLQTLKSMRRIIFLYTQNRDSKWSIKFQIAVSASRHWLKNHTFYLVCVRVGTIWFFHIFSSLQE